jgi:hypothetical protein
MKAMVASDSAFFGYNGEAEAGVSSIGAIAGYLDSAKTRSWRWFKWMNLTSRLRKATTSTQSPSWVVDESHGFIDQFQKLRGALSHRAPHAMEALESQAGISKWGDILTFKRHIYKPGPINGLYKQLNKFLNGDNAMDHTFRWNGIERLIDGRFGAFFAPNISSHDRFHRFVEYLNLRVPSGILTFKGGNMMIYGGLLFGTVAVASTMGGDDKPHHG